MHLTLGRDRRRPTFRHLLVATAAAAAGTVTFVAAPMAFAANPTLNAPERVYTEVSQTLNFTGTDAISGDNRLISMPDATNSSCNTAAPAYSISGCARLQITLNDGSGGKIFIPQNSVKKRPDNSDVIVAESGAIVDVSTDPLGGAGYIYHLSGTKEQINNAVDGLQYLPVAGFESGADASPHANIHLIAVNGANDTETTTKYIEIRIEGENGAPTLIVPAGPLKASTTQAVSFPPSVPAPAVFDIRDPEMCTAALCGPGYPTPSIDSDDKVLLVASLEGCSNSTFQFRGGAFTTLGSPTLNNVHTLLTAVSGLGLTTAQALPIETSIVTSLGLNFTNQAGGPLSPTAVFAGVGEFDEVQYALSQVTFDTTQTDDTTCVFNLWVSDLGNNGMPLAYVGSPIGGVDMPQPGKETPNAKGAFQAVTVQFSDTKPDVVIADLAASDPTNVSPIQFSVTFSEGVSGLVAGDFDVSGGSVTNLTGGPTAWVATVTPSSLTGEATIELSLPADRANATAAPSDGNDASNTASVDYDGKAPTVTVNQAALQPDPTVATPINFTATFSEAVTGLTNGDVTISGTATGTKTAVVSGGPTVYNIAVSGMTGDGTVIASIGAGVAEDAVGNTNDASTSSDGQVTYTVPMAPDATPPAVLDIDLAVGQADPASGPSVAFDVTFSEPVVGFADADVTLGGTALPTAAVVSGGPSIYTVTVTGMTTTGAVTIAIPANVVKDLANLDNTASPAMPTDDSIDWTTADVTKPTVTVNQAVGQADPTNAGTVNFTVTFSENVTGFTDADVGDLVVGGNAGGTKTVTVTGGPAVYNIAVSGMLSNGTVTASVPAGVAQDAASNTNEASTSADNQVTFDNVAPTVTSITKKLSPEQPDPTAVSPIRYTVTFSEPVTDFSGDDVVVNAPAGSTPVKVVTGGPTVYEIAVSGLGQTSGNVTLDVTPAGVTDLAGNAGADDPAAATVVWQGDTTAPTVTINQKSSAPAQADPTKGSPIRFTVVFSEPVTGFSASGVDLTDSTVDGTLVAAVTGSGTTYTVDVTGMTAAATGTVVAKVSASAAIDGAGNGNLASTSSDNTVTFDGAAPTVTVEQAGGQAGTTSVSPILFTATFSEPVSGFTAGDVRLNASTAGGLLVTGVSGGPTVYTVSVSGMTTSGTVVASIDAGRAFDVVGTGNSASTSADNIVVWSQPGELTKPSVTIDQGAIQADPTTAPTIVFDVVFSEPVTGFTNSDVILGGTAGANTKSVTGSLANYTVTVSGMSQTGTVTATIPANAAQDPANNLSLASTSTDNQVNWVKDTTKPSVTVEQAVGQADPANSAPIVFTATFTEPVTGFTNTDVTVGGTAGATTAAVTGGPTVYTINVTGMTQNGTVTASIPAGAASDEATNTSNASTSADNTVTYDATAPTVTIEQAAGQTDPTNAGPITFTATFSEAVTGFTNTDVTIGGTAGATTAAVTGGPTVYTVTVTGMTQAGTVTAAIPAAAATDSAANANTASASTDNSVTFDATAPTVTIDQAAGQADPTSGSSIQFTATFSEAVTGFTNADVTIGGTAGATTAAVTGGPTVYTVTVTGMTTNGTVTAAVDAGGATDGAGNVNTASTSADNSVNWLVVSAPQTIATPGGDVTIAVSPGSQLIFFTTTTPQVPPPPGVLFPYGQMSFSASTTPGGLVTFTMTLPAPAQTYYKLFGNSWLSFDWDGETGAQLNGTTLTITIRDNGRGDSDATPGIATDPGAIGINAELPATGSDTRRLLWPAAMLVAAGIVLLFGQRRRRPAEVRV